MKLSLLRQLAKLLVVALLFGSGLPLSSHANRAHVVYMSYADAQPILEQLNEIAPTDLKGKTPSQQETNWAGWIARHDREIRSRLIQGDEDSLVNFLSFGVTYTRQPRITTSQLAELNQVGQVANLEAQNSAVMNLLKIRIDDLIRAMLTPAANERVLFAKQFLLEQKGMSLKTATGRAQVKHYLIESVARVLGEHAAYARVLEAARLLGNPSEEFAERSRLYRTRGLSSDTSLLPNFALEESLKDLKTRGLLAPKTVSRIAIIGPGLDFTDKQEGYDFYPQQTLQPFAIVDTLLRLGLAKTDALQITTLDLSPRVNDHLARARQRALRGQAYTVQLPRDDQANWKPEVVRYWTHFGDQIGTPVPPVPVPAGAGDLQIRAVRIRPGLVTRVTPLDLNVVTQHIEATEPERFDLIVATNILVYYDTFEQTLATKNIEQMLRPGGFLLSNNALLEFPFSRLHSAGYTTAVYSDRQGDGDHIVWYRRVQK